MSQVKRVKVNIYHVMMMSTIWLPNYIMKFQSFHHLEHKNHKISTRINTRAY